MLRIIFALSIFAAALAAGSALAVWDQGDGQTASAAPHQQDSTPTPTPTPEPGESAQGGSAPAGPPGNEQEQELQVNNEPEFDGDTAERAVAENSAVGAAVGKPVTATDADRDPLTYGLTGSDAFGIDVESGQITVKGALDYEATSSYTVTVSVSDGLSQTNPNDDSIDDTIAVTVKVTNVDEPGTVTVERLPKDGNELHANLVDPDGVVGEVSWSWSRSADGENWTAIEGASGSSYTLTDGDYGRDLRATASYEDAFGPGKSAQGQGGIHGVAAPPSVPVVPNNEPETPEEICDSLNVEAHNSELKADCMVLLDIQDDLAIDHFVNWGNTPISKWHGVNVGGNPARVIELNLDMAASLDIHVGGTIPAEIGKLTALVHLSLNHTKLRGSIPSQLGQLVNIEYLDLQHNSLSGNIPVSLGKLTKMVRLDLSHNQLSGSIPSELGELTQLTTLKLSENNFTGCVPANIRLAGHTGVAEDVGLAWCDEDDEPTGVPTISGKAQVGETLTADTSGIADADGLTNVNWSYQWLADDTAISGATGSTYKIQADDEGKTIKIRVDFIDDEGHPASLTSVPTAAVVAGGL